MRAALRAIRTVTVAALLYIFILLLMAVVVFGLYAVVLTIGDPS